MKSQALQEMVKKIFSDETTRKQFVSDPGSVISQYSLTEEEKKAVMCTFDRMGVATSDSPQLAAVIGPMGTWL